MSDTCPGMSQIILDASEAAIYVHCSVDSQKRSLKTILLVDDHDESRLTAKWFLNSFGYAVDTVRSAEDALTVFDSKVHDLIITEHFLQGMSGVEMAHIIKLRSALTPVVLRTATPPSTPASTDLVLDKTVHLLVLKDAIEQLLARKAP